MKLLRDNAKKIILINLLFLVFPWGLGLVLIPGDLAMVLGVDSTYWSLLGVASLLGAVIYYLAYRFYEKRLSLYIFIFGVIDNFLAGVIIALLFVMGRVPLIAFLNTALLFFFSYFFWDQTCCHLAFKEKGDKKST